MDRFSGLVRDTEQVRHRISRLYSLEVVNDEELQKLMKPCLELLHLAEEYQEKYESELVPL